MESATDETILRFDHTLCRWCKGGVRQLASGRLVSCVACDGRGCHGPAHENRAAYERGVIAVARVLGQSMVAAIAPAGPEHAPDHVER